MLKKNIFLASVRQRGTDGKLTGAIVERVICSTNEDSARVFVGEAMPDVGVVSLTSLCQLEERAQKIKSVLSGSDKSWPVMIDPLL